MNPWQDRELLEVEFSGGPCDGLRYRLPNLDELRTPEGSEILFLFPDGRHPYRRTGRLTADGLVVFEYAGRA